MGRRTQSLLHDQFPAELDALHDNAEHVAKDQPTREPFPWTILLTTAGLLRWRSVRRVPESEPRCGEHHTTTSQMLLVSTRVGIEPVLVTNGKAREESPAPLTPDDIEARDDLAFYLDRCQREREQEAAYHREWIPRLQKLGLTQCRLGGLPTEHGKPCACRTCRGIPLESSPWRPPVPSKSP